MDKSSNESYKTQSEIKQNAVSQGALFEKALQTMKTFLADTDKTIELKE